jgi:hypothetical protein
VVVPYVYWQDAQYYVPHASFDEIKANSIAGTNIKPAVFDKAVAIEVSNTVSALYLWGWAAVMAEPYEFGYVIDDGEIIMNSEFTFEAEQSVVDAIANVGGLTGNRFAIAVDVAALEGAHNIKALVQLDGQYIIIAECNINKDGVTDTEETQPDDTPDVESANGLVIDVAGHELAQDFSAGGYDAWVIKFTTYGKAANLGELDLSKYEKVIITYGSDKGAMLGDLGGTVYLTSTGAIVDKKNNPIDYTELASATLSNPEGNWAAGNRTVEISLADVNYNGPVYLTYNVPEKQGMVVSAITFVASAAEEDTSAPADEDTSAPAEE